MLVLRHLHPSEEPLRLLFLICQVVMLHKVLVLYLWEVHRLMLQRETVVV